MSSGVTLVERVQTDGRLILKEAEELGKPVCPTLVIGRKIYCPIASDDLCLSDMDIYCARDFYSCPDYKLNKNNKK